MNKVIFLCIALLFSLPREALAASPIQTQHFRIVSFGGEVPESELKKISGQLESTYSEIVDFLGIEYTSSGKIEIRVYLKPEHGRNIRASAGSATMNLQAGRDNNSVIKHELTHILISKPLSTAPRWFHEGLAMYMEFGDIRKATYDSLPAFNDFSFVKLEARFGAAKTDMSSYLYAWSIFSYLMDDYGKDKLKQIFNQSGSFSEKFSKSFGVDLNSIEKKANEIFNKYKPKQ